MDDPQGGSFRQGMEAYARLRRLLGHDGIARLLSTLSVGVRPRPWLEAMDDWLRAASQEFDRGGAALRDCDVRCGVPELSRGERASEEDPCP